MKDDPIVKEVRRAREAYAAKFGYDIAKIVDDLRRYPAPTVRRPPKRVKPFRRAS
jgi:hypothetical protein